MTRLTELKNIYSGALSIDEHDALSKSVELLAKFILHDSGLYMSCVCLFIIFNGLPCYLR